MSPTAFQSESLTSRVYTRLHSRCPLRAQQFIITSERCLHEPGQQRSVRALASLDAPSQESQSGRRGVPRLAGSNVCLINPDCHHPQLLELRKLNQKRWLSLTIPNQALGGLGAKERSEATRGPPPRRCRVPKGPTQKGNTAQQYYPQLRPLDLRPPQKNKAEELGASITPNFGLLASRLKSKRACGVERLGLSRKKRWRDGTAGIADRAIAEPGSTGAPRPKS